MIGTVIGTLIAFVLTLMVYRYLGKDIPFLYAIYRVAAYVFVGGALGYGTIVAWHSVLSPRLLLRLESGQWWFLVPLVLCLLLLSKVKRSWSPAGNITLAFLFGVGAALAVGGGLIGTLLPQVQAGFVSLNPAHYEGTAILEGGLPLIYVSNAVLVTIGTISTLLFFTFTTRAGAGESDPGSSDASGSSRPLLAVGGRVLDRVVYVSRGFGKVFLMFTFGALFATTAISYMSLLVDRVRFIIETIWAFLPIS
jgi:hypothetical protein